MCIIILSWPLREVLFYIKRLGRHIMSPRITFPEPVDGLKKLKEAILYIAESCKADEDFGAIKLNKILFIADFYAFSVLTKPITEATYFHLPKGPAPKQLLPAQEELISEKRAKLTEREYHGKTQKRIIALKKPNVSVFSKEEIEIIDIAIEATCGRNGTQLSDWTHDLIPWILSAPKEDIPFATVFTMFDKPVGIAGLSWGEAEVKHLLEIGHGSF